MGRQDFKMGKRQSLATDQRKGWDSPSSKITGFCSSIVFHLTNYVIQVNRSKHSYQWNTGNGTGYILFRYQRTTEWMNESYISLKQFNFYKWETLYRNVMVTYIMLLSSLKFATCCSVFFAKKWHFKFWNNIYMKLTLKLKGIYFFLVQMTKYSHLLILHYFITI